jgi:hypothetical protein
MRRIFVPGFIAGFIMLFISVILSQLSVVALPYLNIEFENYSLYRPWSDPIMLFYFIQPFFLGWVLAWIWNQVKGFIGEKHYLEKGLYFGLAFWVVSLPGLLLIYSTFQVSLAMINSWVLTIFIQSVCAGLALAWMNR